MTRLVLANAVYFKGKWANPFDPASEGRFLVASNDYVKCMIMRREETYAYADLSTLKVLELPYRGDDLSMVVVLPKQIDGLKELEQQLSAAKLKNWIGALKKKRIDAILPRLRLTCEFQLQDHLTAMGMGDAFNCLKADFSGMDGKKNLCISKVAHKAFVDVQEEGTEAAAATGVNVVAMGISVTPLFQADHPYLFLIRDRHTGSILFLGRVMDPSR